MPARTFYVAVTSTSRHYGGPEEGGWWYDWTDVDELHVRGSKPAARRLARRLQAELDRYRPRHNRFSVLGGADSDVIVTRDRAKVDDLQTRRRPRYE